MASRSWNRVELIGNLTRDPELRYTPNGAAVATFSIATNRTYMSEGERKEEADFHRCVAWNKLAELCQQLLKKGNRIFVSGRLQNRSWETPEGQQRNMTEIVIEDMILLTSGRGEAMGGEEYPEEIPQRPAERPVTPAAEETPAEAVEPQIAEVEQAPTEEKEDAKKSPKTEDVGDLDDLPF